jgi:basic membrane lipoprotein Med (substrate-binding protein (PBP1-ABC) superfamily)/maltose-binding protein MalE
MRKWFSTLMVLAVVLAMAATSCAPAATPTPTPKPVVQPTAVPPTAAPPTAVPVEPVTITVWDQEGDTIEAQILDPLINEFMAANPSITVERTHYDNEALRTQFQTASLAGQAPDLFRGPNDPIGVFAAMGIVMPVTDMFDQAFLDTFLPGALAGGVLKGVMYGIPDVYGNHLMLLYNKAMVTKVPADWDELIATAQGLTTGDNWGLVLNIREPFWLAAFLGGFGGTALDPATDAPTLNTPAMVKTLQFMSDLQNKYKIVPPGCDYNTADTVFKEGKAAFLVNGDWSLSGYSDPAQAPGLTSGFGTAAMPPIKETGLYPTPMTSGKYWVISSQVQKGTAKFEAVKEFVEFMAGEHAQTVWLEKNKQLPSNKNVANSPTIQSDPILQGSMAQLVHGVAMPTAPELRCFWDSIRPAQEGVMDGTTTAADAAAKAQTDADRCVKEAGLGAKIQPKIGEVTDMGGIDDKSFNAAAWKGVQDAIDKLGASGKYLESQAQADYAKNIQQFVDEKLDLIVTVGFLLGVDTATAAKANPDLNFAIVDYAYPDCWPGAVVGKDCGSDTPLPNVLGLTFQTDEAAFLAGYLAAGMTKSGKVGTFGGVNIPTVTIFMKGFEAGVKYYNQQNGTSVEVLGWNTATADGLFTGNFESTDDGRKFGQSLMEEGADIILPVAGPVGLGTAAVCKESGGCTMIGVDVDQYISAPEFSSVWLTSVMKMIDAAVFDACKQVAYQYFQGGTNYVGTLANGGVGIAPFHDFDSKVPDKIKADLDAIKADIIAGKITVDGVLAQ